MNNPLNSFWTNAQSLTRMSRQSMSNQSPGPPLRRKMHSRNSPRRLLQTLSPPDSQPRSIGLAQLDSHTHFSARKSSPIGPPPQKPLSRIRQFRIVPAISTPVP